MWRYGLFASSHQLGIVGLDEDLGSHRDIGRHAREVLEGSGQIWRIEVLDDGLGLHGFIRTALTWGTSIWLRLCRPKRRPSTAAGVP